jgi:hypothetical protein
MAMLAEGPLPGGGVGIEEMVAEEGPLPGAAPGGGDVVVQLEELLSTWDDKEHPYYKDVEMLVESARVGG